MNKMIDFLISLLVFLLLLKLVFTVFNLTVATEKIECQNETVRAVKIYNPERSVDLQISMTTDK